MKNFETLYKILMNEAEYDDVAELGEVEADFEQEENLTERGKKLKEIQVKFPNMSDEKAGKMVDNGITAEDFGVEVDALDFEDEVGNLPTEDDLQDIATGYEDSRRIGDTDYNMEY